MRKSDSKLYIIVSYHWD